MLFPLLWTSEKGGSFTKIVSIVLEKWPHGKTNRPAWQPDRWHRGSGTLLFGTLEPAYFFAADFFAGAVSVVSTAGVAPSGNFSWGSIFSSVFGPIPLTFNRSSALP